MCMSWFREGKENDNTEIKPRNQILQTSLTPENNQKQKLESNERKRHNEFADSIKAPESSGKEKLSVIKKDGNASNAANNGDAPNIGQREREREREDR